MNKISVIVRTKNEERWIGHCLKSIFEQKYESFEVILVDNCSTDNTLLIASRFPISNILKIEEFFPGKAINLGIEKSTGDLIACISAHCIPKNKYWLTNLSRNIINAPKVAGVYGRQLPTSFTSDIDRRDLLLVFGRDKRVQIKDYFFHNANSMFRRDVWEKYKFNEKVTNIEDRVWGKEVTEDGFSIIYEPEASVYHHHGLHQGNNKKRAKGVVSVINKVEAENFSDLPDCLKPENFKVVAIVPVSLFLQPDSFERDLLIKTLNQLHNAKYVKETYIISNQEDLILNNEKLIQRKQISNEKTINLDELLIKSLDKIEEQEIFPDSIVYVNYDYMNRPEWLFDKLIEEFLYNGYDTTFSGFEDYSHYWFKNKDDSFVQTDDSFNTRKEREPVFRALYGLGCVTGAYSLRKGKLVGGKIGILPLNEETYAKRYKK